MQVIIVLYTPHTGHRSTVSCTTLRGAGSPRVDPMQHDMNMVIAAWGAPIGDGYDVDLEWGRSPSRRSGAPQRVTTSESKFQAS
jgi:hypothetical protein